jgi:hypothetical protein
MASRVKPTSRATTTTPVAPIVTHVLHELIGDATAAASGPALPTKSKEWSGISSSTSAATASSSPESPLKKSSLDSLATQSTRSSTTVFSDCHISLREAIYALKEARTVSWRGDNHILALLVRFKVTYLSDAWNAFYTEARLQGKGATVAAGMAGIDPKAAEWLATLCDELRPELGYDDRSRCEFLIFCIERYLPDCDEDLTDEVLWSGYPIR